MANIIKENQRMYDNQLEMVMEKDFIHRVIKYYEFNYNLKVQEVCP